MVLTLAMGTISLAQDDFATEAPAVTQVIIAADTTPVGVGIALETAPPVAPETERSIVGRITDAIEQNNTVDALRWVGLALLALLAYVAHLREKYLESKQTPDPLATLGEVIRLLTTENGTQQAQQLVEDEIREAVTGVVQTGADGIEAVIRSLPDELRAGIVHYAMKYSDLTDYDEDNPAIETLFLQFINDKQGDVNVAPLVNAAMGISGSSIGGQYVREQMNNADETR